MNNNSQILKGVLEGCILQIINYKEETYGYEVVTELRNYGFKSASESTIYPILTRLEKRGVLSSCKKPSPLGPQRKYYSLTCLGEEELQGFKDLWDELKGFVDGLLVKGSE
ncbi:PadR family transcriptional regulator [Clostridium sp. B9]|uniref:PadR family transcriptional regulator n=1 Tax=Clostridium sp. B9 TaxID=3423224 RepID=UPI003D2EAB9C